MKIFHIGLSATGAPHNGLQEAFVNNCTEYAEINTAHPQLNEKCVEVCKAFRPDLVFIQVQTPDIIREETIISMRKTGAWICNWTGDVRHPIPQWYYDLGKHLNVTLFTNFTDVHKMRADGLPSDYLQIGFDPKIYFPRKEYTHDAIPFFPIIFMANNYPEHKFPMADFRTSIIDSLKTLFPNDFALFGNGWQNAQGSYNGSQLQESLQYNHCSIAVNCSHFDYERYSSDRFLRIMGSGAFCLTQHWQKLEVDFIENKHLVAFNSIPEMADLCKHYLAQNHKREKIAERGSEYVHKYFTFDCMIKNLIKIYEKKKWK